MTIDLPISWDGVWRVVPAKLIDPAPHITQWTFAVHRLIGTQNCWRVANVETGALLNSQIFGSPEYAEQLAREYLADKTDADVGEAVERLPKWQRT